MFGSLKINKIQYYSHKQKEWLDTNIKDIKVKCICHIDSIYKWNMGINIAVVFGERQREAFDDINSIFSMTDCQEELPYTFYLLGENEVKIPFYSSGGNQFTRLKTIRDGDMIDEYDEETGCIHGYMPPLMLDNQWASDMVAIPDVHPQNNTMIRILKT